MLSASVGEGFPYADVPHMGMAFVAISDGDRAKAQDAALAMARAAWDRRAELTMKGLSIADAVAMAAASTDPRPVTLLDSGDNVGGGSSGDSTFLLKALLRSGARNFAITFVDPEVVAECIRTGVGSDVDLKIGGKIDRLHGDPVRITGRVRLLSDGIFHDDAPIHGGWKDFAPGPTAVIVTPERGTLIVNSLAIPANSLEQLRSVGLHPEAFQAIVAKGVNSPRPAYGPISSQMLLVDTPGAAAADLSTFTYNKRPRPMFPFEDVPRP
jgi:microcystin degradation protein MlrC